MFNDAISYLITHLDDKSRGLNNEAPLRWFTDKAESYSELIGNTLDPEKDNTKLAELYTKPVLRTGLLVAAHARLDAIVAMQRDVRAAYAAGEDHDPFTTGDADRHAYMQALYLGKRFKQVQEMYNKED